MWIDVDEVLADFAEGTFRLAKYVLGREVSDFNYDGTRWELFALYSPEERDRLIAECEKPGFCESLKVRPGAPEAVAVLREHVDLFAVTSHFHSPTWVYERDRWLKRHFAFEKSNIVHTSAKFLVNADICLDDNPKHVTSWQAEHPDGLAMLWHIPQTRNMPGLDEYRVHTWPEVIDRVSAFKAKDSVYDLLDNREFYREGEPYTPSNCCLTCGVTAKGSGLPKHEDNCRLDEILTRYRKRTRG